MQTEIGKTKHSLVYLKQFSDVNGFCKVLGFANKMRKH